ncbi:bifunctional sugar phosphate isomerase/epimerase/4-hydroxyphenylpyruvate dioxygenase family protein [Paracraurococcus ruber]|uniref:3-dehydroshikimate dehydratase n=1 Tax=Paracraurococcus ruber TaxID=77675 RepID=A0ABS1CSQ2_9PROT|nr:sugar phosphate isomerase/epimerase and 4-hydroxyphenylpyruvate domain-containing protein [Paracraurococcus ruber]MBK1657400.1 3-keto-5-aminohexanoate cleavage protein [Paracraurococcus ruber]TDG32418.1 sugar phosphate isomerase/epimerase and 4-hydroxyphenylpyruvate domain-containing protein [Paracraurococcus ruber]
MPLPKSIATVCLSGALPDKLEAAALVGFQGVEIFENDLLTYDGSPEEVGRLCRDLGLAVTIYQPFRDFEAMPEPQRRRNLDRAERKFDTMQALGTDLILVCSNTQPATLPEAERAAADLREMAERAAKRGLRVGYEALAWGRQVSLWRQAWDIVRQADHPALGLILDSFHTLSRGDDLAGLEAVPAEKLFFLQLADAPRLSMDVLSWSRHFRLFPGQGELPVADFLRDVLRAGYAGPVSLEIFNDEFRAAPVRRIARDALRSLVLLDDQVRGAVPVPASPLPAAPTLAGIEFVEFAVDDAAREALGGFLGTLGFRRAGLHRSKAVELQRQGGVNLVLNSEPDSAAAERFEMFGPAVCAMALRVDDPDRALARARALLSPAWQERVGQGEQRIPAIRAPDGTLVYLVRTGSDIWADDFQLLPGEGGAPAFTGIDHVVQALAPGHLDGFVLFYRAVFGLDAEPVFELPDPFGIVRSRTLSAANRTVRLPLNVSESRQTGTGRFVSAYAGAGVHHIAFAAPDAAALVAAAPDAPMLEIPENYYDDLAARLGLEDAQLAALQRAHLLFDQDAQGGRFTHAYTQAFQDRFFFEVVERRGGYDQYGAANAAVRMAAQARQQKK